MKNHLINQARKWAAVLCLMLMTTMARVCFGQEPGITQILPTVSQLGEGWSSNRVVLLVDPLSSPSEVADPRDVRNPEASLRERRETLAKGNLVAHGFARYYRGKRQNGVFVTRFKTQAALEETWNRSPKETDPTVGIASGIGEVALFYERDGMHSDVCFRRGNYLIVVECGIDLGVDDIKQLASALDGNLLKAQNKLKSDTVRVETKWQPYVLKTLGGLVTITNPPRSNPVHIAFVRWESDETRGKLAVYRLTNAESHTIMVWDARVQVHTGDSSVNRSESALRENYVATHPVGPAPEHAGWETVQEDWPPSERKLHYAPGVSDEFWVKRPSRTPWRVCIVYSKDWTDSGNTSSGDYEVISAEMKE